MNTRNHLLTEKHQSVMLSILSQTTSHLLNTKNDQQLQSSEMDLDLPPTTISTPTTSNDTLGETINVLLGSIQALNDDTQRHSSESLRTQYSLQILSENLSKLKLSIQETNASIGGFKPNQQILQQDIDSLKEDLEDQQATSYDGTLIWRITDVQKKMGM
jgi:chromosome segregation ATPase